MALWKDKGKGWRYQFQVAGVRYNSKHYQTKTEAIAAMAEQRKLLKSTAGKPIQAAMDCKTAASLYLDYSERKHAKQTFEYKKYVLKNFCKLYGDTAMEAITPQQAHSYLATRPTNHNYNAHRKDLYAFFEYAIRMLKVITHNPVHELDKMPYTPPRKAIPSEEDILKLILASDPKTDEKDLLLVVMLTMARVDEILRLTWLDVNFEHQTVSLWTRKRKDGNMESDLIPMNEDLKEILLKRWKSKTQTEWVFYNDKTHTRFNRRPKFMGSLCKRARITPIGFHALRHFMASYLADKQKISKMTISQLLRHKSLGTTEIYLQSIGDGVRSAMGSIDGLFTEQRKAEK